MSDIVDVTLSASVDSDPCKLTITFSSGGLMFFKCETHSDWTETKYKETLELSTGNKEYERTKYEGSKLSVICRNRIRGALRTFMEAAQK